MIALDNGVLRVSGTMRLPEAMALRDAGLALLPSAKSIDLSAVEDVDSSAIAVLLALSAANLIAVPLLGRRGMVDDELGR